MISNNTLFSVKNCLAALTIALITASCGKSEAPPPQALPVSILNIKTQNVPVFYEYVGQTAGSREIEVRARVGGILLRRTYEEGKPVHAGQLLFQIDPAPYQAALDQASADLSVQNATLLRARQDYNRMVPLFKEKAVSQKDYDDAHAAFLSAQAAVAASKARLQAAKIDLGYTRVTAPISGITSKEAVSEGSLIATTAEASLLTKISQLDPIYVNFNMSSTEASQLRNMVATKQLKLNNNDSFDVSLVLDNGQVYGETGELNFTDSIVSTETGTIRSRAIFKNDKDVILPGEFVRVRLQGAIRPNVIAIPQKAVLSSQQGKQVWVLSKEGTAEARNITLGQESGELVIVESGLKVGDKVVTDNLMKVRPGAPLKDSPADQKPAAAPAKK